MKVLHIFGDSDDRREVDGDLCEEEYVDVCKIWRPVEDGQEVEEGLFVVYQYSEAVNNGCWMVGFQPLGEGIEIPQWAQDVKISLASNEYSVCATLAVPDDTHITWYNKYGEEVES